MKSLFFYPMFISGKIQVENPEGEALGWIDDLVIDQRGIDSA